MQNLKVLSIPEMLINPQSSDGCNTMPESYSLQGGELFVDGNVVPSYFTNNIFYWERITGTNEIERGCIRLQHHGMMTQGIYERDGKKVDFTATARNIYALSVQTDKEVIDWCDFEMGVKKLEDGSFKPYGKLIFPKDDPLAEIDPESLYSVSYSVVENHLKVNINFNTDLYYYFSVNNPCRSAAFQLSINYETCEKGEFIEFNTNPDAPVKKYVLKGKCKNSQIPVLKSARLKMATSRQTAQQLKTRAVGLINQLPKTLDDLFTLPTPNMNDIQNQSMNTLYYLMIYKSDSYVFENVETKEKVKWITWFNQEKSQAEKNLRTEDYELLKDKEISDFMQEYAKAVLADAFAASSDEKIKARMSKAKGNPGDKMLYYFKGSEKGCLSRNSAFNRALNIVMQSTYERLVPGLGKYLTDDKEAWAKKLYDHCLLFIPQFQVQMVSGGKDRINHLSMVMNFLKPEKCVEYKDDNSKSKKTYLSYGCSFYAKVMEYTLKQILDTWMAYDEATIKNFFENFFEAYFNEIMYNKTLPLESEVFKALKEEIEKFEKEWGTVDAHSYALKMSELAAEFIDLIMGNKGLPLPKILEELLKKISPAARAYMGNSICLALFALPLIDGIKNLLDWKSLTNAEKAEAISECCVGGLGMFTSLAKFKAIRTLSNPNATSMEKFNAAQMLKFSGKDVDMIEEISKAGRTTIDKSIINTGRYTAVETAKVGGEDVVITRWTKAFRVTVVVLRVFTVVLLGVTAFMLGSEIANDFKMHVSPAIKAFDILELISVSLSVIFEVVSFVLDVVNVACSAIPIIGTVIVLLGLVFSVISMILRKYQTPPATTIEHFVSEVIVVFVDTLPAPSQKWLDENKGKVAV